MIDVPFNNQYLLTDRNLDVPGLNHEVWCGLHVYHNTVLTRSSGHNRPTLLIGIAVHPLSPQDSIQDIVDDLADISLTWDDVCRKAQLLTGRFVLAQDTEYGIRVSGDACHTKRILFAKYENASCVTSSESMFHKLFNVSPEISPAFKSIVSTPWFSKNEHACYGNDTLTGILRIALPNTFLNWRTMTLHRVSFDVSQAHGPIDQRINHVMQILNGTYKALTDKYHLLQPLTAGWDSRVLLGASLPFRKQINYYVFETTGAQDDVTVSRLLATKYNLQFAVRKCPPITHNFKKRYEEENILPRMYEKHSFIQYHYEQRYEPNVINVNGNVAEIFRAYYGVSGLPVSQGMLATLSGVPKSSLFRKSINDWYLSAAAISKKTQIPIQDLFYWEQRMGNWGVLFPLEQDIAVEEISPFNNKELILQMLSMPRRYRCSPDYKAVRMLLDAFDTGLAEYGFNPSGNKLKKIVKRYSEFLYLAKLVKA